MAYKALNIKDILQLLVVLNPAIHAYRGIRNGPVNHQQKVLQIPFMAQPSRRQKDQSPEPDKSQKEPWR
ncbi:MAG: hypothetical protein COB37_07545 [Kordiimonadales bacterium]|nr:MAG: hypothetical protein COB37_07545 [Kordiimonadales bacterium]